MINNINIDIINLNSINNSPKHSRPRDAAVEPDVEYVVASRVIATRPFESRLPHHLLRKQLIHRQLPPGVGSVLLE